MLIVRLYKCVCVCVCLCLLMLTANKELCEMEPVSVTEHRTDSCLYISGEAPFVVCCLLFVALLLCANPSRSIPTNVSPLPRRDWAAPRQQHQPHRARVLPAPLRAALQGTRLDCATCPIGTLVSFRAGLSSTCGLPC
jgi:hypothetical protein